MIKKDGSIVVLTGAGISADSGIQTFRSSDGLWCNHRVEDVATPEAFARKPDLVHDFYNQRRRQLLDPGIKPNKAHYALAELEQNWDGEVLIITQNIDDLHDRAGNKNLIHMHGELLKIFCTLCGEKDFCNQDVNKNSLCTKCQKQGHLRPDIVWFGEMPYKMDLILKALTNCDLFISIGTSGNVYPAAGFVMQAKKTKAIAVEINLEESNTASAFDKHIYGKAIDTVPEFVKNLLLLSKKA